MKIEVKKYLLDSTSIGIDFTINIYLRMNHVEKLGRQRQRGGVRWGYKVKPRARIESDESKLD